MANSNGNSDISKTVVRVGSRKSQLALIQTHHVVDLLSKQFADHQFEIMTMDTLGDNILNKALSQIGEKSLFTRELEMALEAQEVDLVVHSLKDLPTVLPPGMVIGAILEREDPRDAVIMSQKFAGETLATFPEGSVVGTSSLRRAAQLQHHFPHLQFKDVRGNLNTRLKKLDDPEGPYSALILAVAGVRRMNWESRISQYLDPDISMYAVGQGALGIECRENDLKTRSLLSHLKHTDTLLRCIAERAFLRTLEGGCSAPVAVESQITVDKLSLSGSVWSLDGTQSVIRSKSIDLAIQPADSNRISLAFVGVASSDLSDATLEAAENLGVQLAKEIQGLGGDAILTEAKKETERRKLVAANVPPTR